MTVWTKTGSSTWTKINSIFNKTNSTSWTEILGVWVKTATTWIRVFTRVSVPANTVAPEVTGSAYLYGTLSGTLGTWTAPNGTNSYARQWQSATNNSGSAGSYGNISGATSSTYTTTINENGRWVRLRVTATNLSGDSVAFSNEVLITKYSPVSLLPYTLSGIPTVGGTLTAQEQGGSWKNTTTNTGDTYPDTFSFEWSYSNGTIIQSPAYNGINSNNYLIQPADLGTTIRVRVTGTNTGGSETSAYTTSGTVTSTYSFAFGNILYVGSNGYITLDQAPSPAIAALPAGNGRTINIWNEDLVQYRLQEYSDSSNYHLYFRAYLYQSPLVQSSIYALDYQIKFYTNQPYCDVYLVRKGSSVPTYINNPGYYSNGLFGTSGFSGTFVAGSVLRVYFDGTTPASTSAASWTSISDSVWKDITTSQIDDSFTAVTTSANQQAPTPVNTVAPTLTTNTGNFSSGSIITVNAGTWTNAASYTYEILYSSATPVLTSSSTYTTNSSNQYTITNSDATAPSYYFRAKVTAYTGTGQTGNSTIAYGDTSSRSYINPSTTISVGTATTSGFTISGTASPVSNSVAYVNVTSIQIFNSSFGLVATKTTGMPTVNATTGAWSYVWNEGSSSTTYYAKATVTATDSNQTTFTTAFSSSITTSTATTVPGAVRNLSYSLIAAGARITWDAPLSDGGSAITKYEVKRDSFAYFSVGNVTSYDYTLSGGTYTIFVRAVNAIGNGPESSISVTVPVPTPTVDSCNVITGGRSGTSPNFTWPNPKALFTFTCSNAASADVQIQYSQFGTSWLDANAVQNLSVVSNQVSIQTNQPGTNIGNYYYRATCKPYSGSSGSGTAGTQRITAAVQNTATAKNQAVSIS